jgi:hypothetical protein
MGRCRPTMLNGGAGISAVRKLALVHLDSVPISALHVQVYVFLASLGVVSMFAHDAGVVAHSLIACVPVSLPGGRSSTTSAAGCGDQASSALI